MMTRTEFNAFWLPRLNDLASRKRMGSVSEADLDGLWHNYVNQQDEGLQARADAVAETGQ